MSAARSTGERKTVAVFDLDGTLTRYDAFVRFLLGSLLRTPARWRHIPALVMAVAASAMGRRDRTWLKTRFLRLVLAGVPNETMERRVGGFVAGLVRGGLRAGALAQVEAHRAAGDTIVLATASPDVYATTVADRLGIETVLCTVTERDEWRRLTGALVGSNCHGPEKVRRLHELLGSERDDVWVVAYSDHHSDLPVLLWADEGVAVSPTPTLARAAAERGLRVALW